jgi:hypothetical protein
MADEGRPMTARWPAIAACAGLPVLAWEPPKNNFLI